MKLDEYKIAEYLAANIDNYATSYLVVSRTGACDRQMDGLSEEEMFRMDREVFEIGRRNGFLLSRRHHDFEVLGMPWNIDFRIIANINNYFEDTLSYGSLVRYEGDLMSVRSMPGLDDDTVFMFSQDGQEAIEADRKDVRLLEPFTADEETVRKFFRLDASSWDLAQEGRFPFRYDSESIAIDGDDLKAFCENAKKADDQTMYSWRKLFIEQDYASCLEEIDSKMNCAVLWQIIRKVFLWFDYEEEDLVFFEDWHRAYEKNKGKFLSELDLDINQKCDLCSYLKNLSETAALSEEQTKAYRKYLDELVEEENYWGIEEKAYGCYGGNGLLECDWKESERLLLKLYEMGNGRYEAANALGYIYYSDRLGEPDYDKAFRYFSEAAAMGNIEAQYKLADMYRKGHGTGKDADKAFKAYKQLYELETSDDSMDGGYKLADLALRMGYCYENGEGVERDLARAREYYKMAYRAINARIFYSNDYGDDVVKENIEKALERTGEVTES